MRKYVELASSLLVVVSLSSCGEKDYEDDKDAGFEPDAASDVDSDSDEDTDIDAGGDTDSDSDTYSCDPNELWSFDFDDGEVPDGWSLGTANCTAQVSCGLIEQHLEASPTDGAAWIERPFGSSSEAGEIRFEWDANHVNSYWGSRTIIEFGLDESPWGEAPVVQFRMEGSSYGYNGLNTVGTGVYDGVVRLEDYHRYMPSENEVYHFELRLEDEWLTATITYRDSGDPYFHYSEYLPELRLDHLSSVGIKVSTTTGDTLWIDDFSASWVHVGCLDTPTPPEGAGTNTGETWEDAANGLMWQDPPAAGAFNGPDAAVYCEGLELASHSDWRVPTIDELRTLVEGCNPTEPGGGCGVEHSCAGTSYNAPTCLGTECSGCESRQGPGAMGCYWSSALRGECKAYFLSSTSCDADTWWAVGYKTGVVGKVSKNGRSALRCVRDV